MRIIRFADLETVPWKNGGGITREIAAVRRGDQIYWRISMADVDADGPFSKFNGLTRILTVIEGTGLRLISADAKINALNGEPVEFDGGSSIQSELINGPVRDVNVMFDPYHFSAEVVVAKATTRLNASQTMAITALQGASLINGIECLQFGDTALVQNQNVDLGLPDGACALIVSLNRIQQ